MCVFLFCSFHSFGFRFFIGFAFSQENEHNGPLIWVTVSEMADSRRLNQLLIVFGIVAVAAGVDIRFPRKNILSLEALKNVSCKSM